MEASLAEVRPLEAGVTEVVLRTRAFTTGRFEAPLPPIELERAGEFWGSVELDAVVVTVESVLDPFRLEPRPALGPAVAAGRRTDAGALAVGRDRSSDRAGGGIDGVASAPSLARRRSVHRRGSGRIVSGRLGWTADRRPLVGRGAVRGDWTPGAPPLGRRLRHPRGERDRDGVAPPSGRGRRAGLHRGAGAHAIAGVRRGPNTAAPARPPARLDGYRQLAQSILSESGRWGRRDAV